MTNMKTTAWKTLMVCFLAAEQCKAFTVGTGSLKSATKAPLTSMQMGFRRRQGRMPPPGVFSTGFNDFLEPFFVPGPMMPGIMNNCGPNSENMRNKSGRFPRFTSPRYDISEDEASFQLTIDCPGVKSADLKVTVEEDGRVLRVYGERKSTNKNRWDDVIEKSFILDRTIDTKGITANLSDGVVVISAPKFDKAKDVQEIPVSEDSLWEAETPEEEQEVDAKVEQDGGGNGEDVVVTEV